MRLSALAIAGVWTLGCGSSEPTSSSTPPPRPEVRAAIPTMPAPQGDPLTRLSRVESSDFIEIAEVRAREDGVLLYCTAVRGLHVVDARDPSAMTTRAAVRSKHSHPKFPGCQHVAYDGDDVYVTNRGHRFHPTPFVSAVDLGADPPAETASFTKKGYTFEGVTAVGKHVFVAVHDRGILVLENRGATLREVGHLGGLGTAWAVAADGNKLAVTDAKGGLSLVDIAAPSSPRLLGRVELEGSAQSVEIAGDIAWVAATSAGVVAVNIANPAAPALISEIDSPGTALQVAISGEHLAVANWTDFRVYDIGNPREPRLIGREDINTGKSFSRVLGATIRGKHAFIGEWTGMYGYQLHPERVAPELTLQERMIDIDRVEVGNKTTSLVVVENEGRAPLIISKVATDGAGFSVSPRSATIAPGRLASFEVAFAPAAPGEHKGTLRFESNAPDGIVELPLVGNRPGLGVGDMAPEIEMELVTGGSSWKLSDHRGKVVLLAYFATF